MWTDTTEIWSPKDKSNSFSLQIGQADVLLCQTHPTAVETPKNGHEQEAVYYYHVMET
jgi:hypothetical protein